MLFRSKTAWYRGHFQAPRWDVALVYGHDTPLIRYAARVAGRVVAFEQRDVDANNRLWKAVPTPAASMHAVLERLLLPAALDVETRDHRLAYTPSPSEIAGAQHWLSQQVGADKPIVGFQIASFPTKRYRDWPLERFVELGRRILGHYPGAHILVFGGDESRDAAQSLAQQLGSRVLPVAGRLPLRETAALMQRLDLYVGVDTGPTHLAGALGVPMVALYHCRHRGRYLAPLQHEKLRVIEHPANDTECSNTQPMSDITVDEVWHAVESSLNAL